MKEVTMYKCSYCNKLFSSSHECLVHEALMFNLSLEEYKKWLKLQEKAKQASFNVTVVHNEDNIRIVDETYRNMLAFEEKHNLTDSKIANIKQKHFYEASR